MTDQEALLAAISAKPDADDPRLIYADWLDEQAVASCPCECGGIREADISGSAAVSGKVYVKCSGCGGDGVLYDTSNADRAEFIRVQCEFERHPNAEAIRSANYDAQDGVSEDWLTGFRLLGRYQYLLRQHPEWSQFKCPECGAPRRYERECVTCSCSGDLLDEATDGPHPSRNPQFRRGFIDQIEARYAECVTRRCSGCGGTAPTGDDFITCHCPHASNPVVYMPSLWLLAVLRTCPGLTRVRLTDRVPSDYGIIVHDLTNEPSEGRGWYCGYGPFGSGLTQYAIAKPIWDEIDWPSDKDYSTYWKILPTLDATNDALARAVCVWGRKHIKQGV